MTATGGRSMEIKVDIHIVIDRHEYTVHEREMTGAQLKALAGIPEANLLFLEVHGPGEDEQIQNDTVVQLRDDEHFFDMPPGNFGENEAR
jgi:hypothetical protein